MAAVTKRSYVGAAPACTLTNSITAGDTTALLTGTVTAWNNTANGPFFMVIDPGLSTEEKVLVGARSGSSLSSMTRGVDGTTASSHSAGATCYPVFTATDADEANQFASTMTTRGDLLTMGAGPTVARIAIGTSGQVLTSNGTDAAFGTVAAAGLATDAVTTVKIQDLAVTGVKQANFAVSTKTASYTLVAADRHTRIAMNSASATTITVNTSLFSAGDTLELLNISSGTCTITAGTCTVTTSGSLALAANAGGTLYFTSASAAIFFAAGVATTAGGLVFISTTTVTASATATISNVFTSTYTDYRIVLALNGSTNSNKLRMQLTTSGTPVTSGYAAGCFIGDYSSGAPPLLNYGYAETANFVLGYITNSSTQNTNISLDVYGPQAIQKTAITGLATSVWSGAANAGGMLQGFLDVTTSYDGIKLFNSSATNMTGTVAIYGYAKV